MTTGTSGVVVGAAHRTRAVLGAAMDSILLGSAGGGSLPVDSPWDLWWITVRAGLAAPRLPVEIRPGPGDCERCDTEASSMSRANGQSTAPTHGCAHAWAVRFRRPSTPPRWPAQRLTLLVVKPHVDPAAVRRTLPSRYQVLDSSRRTLTPTDTHRLWPDAYGADYLQRRDEYLTSGPVEVLVLAGPDDDVSDSAVVMKKMLRGAFGTDQLRNGVHMADNPGEALCDIGHLAGAELLAELYGRYDRDTAPARLDMYRDLVACGLPGPHRDPPRRP
ncbi:Nucleoside diphosphate kinase [Parafrankia irregularis]|uniref:Nucleoside diphosphate kinase n=1 Tax=Parafrankia irregularis TaxID=795642 RepID=A0A0S4R1F4_9ACTN|nr:MULTISPECIES: hypothetical protein [Parafrankia]MBE3206705.1 hypothetical protein [Parafrankia sp. CH37]CUU60994.1 Nucleoside diphosphate kinase [Parafrankia irregularis]